ncbi:stage II sporulation protein M [Candidatus Woesearchaeota archaeon]|nr:stage II sporulation protein M [Candidatus Woesearchaeota archaeon]
MVLESIIGPKKAERQPKEMFFYGFLYSFVAVLLSLWIFGDQASLVMVFLIVLASVPLVYRTFKLEEKKDEKIKNETTLLREHAKALTFLMYMSLGIIFCLSLFFIFLPENAVNNLFRSQLTTIQEINTSVNSGYAIRSSFISSILINNFKVLLFSVLFSFFYGAGAIFILTWNSSVIAAAIGTFMRKNINEYIASVGFTKVAGYFHIFSFSLLRYLTHGIFELLAYFIGALAGGLISIVVIRHGIESDKFKRVIKDAFILVVLAVAILIFAAYVEVYITPSFFS